MPRRIRSSTLETRTARLKLPKQRKPFWVSVASGISIGYRRNEGAGSWSVRAADGKGGNWIKSFSHRRRSRGRGRQQRAVILASLRQGRRRWRVAGMPTRGGLQRSARRCPTTPTIAPCAVPTRAMPASRAIICRLRCCQSRSVCSRVRELRTWRNGLAKVMKASSVNRVNKSLKAALNLAAAHDDRISNSKAWTVGLAALPEDDVSESNLVLTDEQRRAVIAAAYDIGPEFGLYVEVHAATGARSSQVAEINVGDLELGRDTAAAGAVELQGQEPQHADAEADADRSRAGAAIEAGGNGARCRRAAAAKAERRPLERGGTQDAVPGGREGGRLAGRGDDLLLAAYRHHARVAGRRSRPSGGASSFDTSVAMLEKTYSKNISSHGDDLMRRAVFDADVPSG